MAKKKKTNEVFEELAKLREEMDKVIKEKGKPALIAVAKELFDFERVDAVRWTQYTPSFNDGDACVFSVCEPEVNLSGTTRDEEDESDDDFFSTWSAPVKKIDGLEEAIDALYQILADNEDVLEQVFGDNKTITITRDGEVELSDYEDY